MQIMEIIFLYTVPIIAVIEGLLIAVGWGLLPNIGKLMLRRKLGGLKNKAFGLTAYDDRVLQAETFDVSPEGALEKDGKKGRVGKTFFLAKPRTEGNNPEANIAGNDLDMDVLPPYSIDGIPFYLNHISKAFATNPRVLAAFRAANRTKDAGKKKFKATAVSPDPIMVDYVDDEGKHLKIPKRDLEVEVYLPFDPVEIKKNIPNYIQQSNIDAMKKRRENMGIEKAKRQNMDIIKPMLIVAAFGIGVSAVITFFG